MNDAVTSSIKIGAGAAVGALLALGSQPVKLTRSDVFGPRPYIINADNYESRSTNSEGVVTVIQIPKKCVSE